MEGETIIIRGSIVMLNVISNNIPIYYFSLYKVPKTIIQDIMKLQCIFLWGGDDESRKINWVSWSILCTTKKGVVLGVKYFERFNIALLRKWNWRILNEKDVIWSELIAYMYGDINDKILDAIEPNNGIRDLLWWKDVRSFGLSLIDEQHWFFNNNTCKLGNGKLIDFWKYKWMGPESLSSLFSSLHIFFSRTNSKVIYMGFWIENI